MIYIHARFHIDWFRQTIIVGVGGFSGTYIGKRSHKPTFILLNEGKYANKNE
jgi:hypothetical protein